MTNFKPEGTLCLKEEYEKLLCLLNEIQQQCVGEIAMGYKMDAAHIGQRIYEVTGLTAPKLADKVKAYEENNN